MPTPKAKTRAKARAVKPQATTLTKAPKSWKLRLFVAGETPKSIRALANLKVLCEKHLKGTYQIEVIDLLEHPELARGNQIVAIPTLEIKLPQQVQKIIGDLSNTDRVLVGLALQPLG